MRIFPETYAVGAQFGVVLVPLKPAAEAPAQAKEAWGRSRPGRSFRAPELRRGRDLSQRWHLHRRPPSRSRELRHRSARRRAAPRLHHQRIADGSARRQSRARFRRRPRRPEGRHHPRHRRSRTPLRRRQAAHVARGALRRALRLRHRAADLRRDPAAGAGDSAGEPRARARRTDQDAHRRPRAARLRVARPHRPAERSAAGGRPHARRRAAARSSIPRAMSGSTRCCCWRSCRRTVRARWPGARCCTTSASRRPFALRPTAFASTATSRWACAWRRRSATACTSPTKTPGRSPRWWPTTCALPTPSA